MSKQINRVVKSCIECGYELRETVNKQAVKSISRACECPQCGSPALHNLYVDERNLPDVKES